MMYKKLIFFISFVLAFCLLQTNGTYAVDPTLVGSWDFNEDSGSVAKDASNSGNDGTLEDGPNRVEGKSGPGLEFDGDDDNVDCGYDQSLTITGPMTIGAWVKPIGSGNSNYPRVVDKSAGTGGAAAGYKMYMRPNDGYVMTGSAGGVFHNSTAAADLGEWNFLAYVVTGDQQKLCMNGTWQVWDDPGIPVASDSPLHIGGSPVGDRNFEGVIDEVRIYNRALTEEEVLTMMSGLEGGYPYASSPEPADGAFHEDTWVTLSWSAGDSAVSHDVYVGDDFDGVDEATRDSEFYRINQTGDFYIAGFPGAAYPEGLIPGTTYYWRIDEVNDADPNSPWKGPVWAFSIPPNTAYNPVPADGDGIAETTVTLSWTPGLGAKLHTVFFGDNDDQVNDTTVGVPLGTPSYSPGPLESEKVYYWRVDEFDGLNTYKGDVWAFATPGAVGNPQPANGATDMSMATTLNWTAADNAASHHVYLGLDKDVVRSADTTSPEYKGSKALGDESYDPGLLDLDSTYYWRIDAVYDGNPVKGPVWTFTVSGYLLVDDFESYTDDDPNNEAIWQHWIDGFGIADNGAQVGYLMPPYAEQAIVHSGAQSMPLFYVNEGMVTNSEAALSLSTAGGLRDWTQAGVGELSFWFRGRLNNAPEPLYAAISNAASAPAVVAYDEPDATTRNFWTQWRIPLQVFADQGIDLTNVDKLAIGLGNKSGRASAGGSGTMNIDDIRLYRP